MLILTDVLWLTCIHTCTDASREFPQDSPANSKPFKKLSVLTHTITTCAASDRSEPGVLRSLLSSLCLHEQLRNLNTDMFSA